MHVTGKGLRENDVKMPAMISFFLSFFFCFVFTKFWLLVSHRHLLYQKIRDEGPKTHLEKKIAVPTMGGIAILLSVLCAITAVTAWQCFQKKLFCPSISQNIYPLLLTFFTSGLLGLADDLMKFFRGKNLGLKGRYKILGECLIGVALWYLLFKEHLLHPYNALVLKILIFVFGKTHLIVFLALSEIFTLLFVVVVVFATTSAVNFTDGLDGLACGVTIFPLLFFLYLGISSREIAVTSFSLTLLGACAAFLWFNAYPAKIFMGDSGSQALGGALAALAFQTRQVFWLPVVGGIFVVETASIIIQVIYFKMTGGKRIFKMSPLHHHFELSGIPENQISVRFWIISMLLCLIALALH
jgi:phospho-N-acetylmuramoyl-pentapeptide-transferase